MLLRYHEYLSAGYCVMLHEEVPRLRTLRPRRRRVDETSGILYRMLCRANGTESWNRNFLTVT
jgi:hypothetical protein